MIEFKQMFDDSSSTYTYLLGDFTTRKAVLIDPVLAHCDDYFGLLQQLNFDLDLVLETHVHADHVTGASKMRQATGARVAVGKLCDVPCADIQLQGGESLTFGGEMIRVLATPGHTVGSVSYVWRDRVFTGDVLFIDGCGRADFQGGDAGQLYDSITQKIWPLPDDTLVYPGHDYHHRHVSSVLQEKQCNPRFLGKTREEFIAFMAQLDLPEPQLMHQAVPANRQCGKKS